MVAVFLMVLVLKKSQILSFIHLFVGSVPVLLQQFVLKRGHVMPVQVKQIVYETT